MPYAWSVSGNEFWASVASSSRVMSSAASSSSNCIGTVSFAGVERAAGAPCGAGGGTGGGAGGGRGGSIGSAAAFPVPDPSLDLASHVDLERLVAGLLQRGKEGLVRVIFGLEAVLRLVLLEVEQAACNLGQKCASQDYDSTEIAHTMPHSNMTGGNSSHTTAGAPNRDE